MTMMVIEPVVKELTWTCWNISWDFHGSESPDRCSILAVQGIRDFYTKYIVNETDVLVAARGIIEEKLLSISKIVKLTDQLA